ncbi:MAG TPA: hypothetical protein VGL89_08490 [Candidatus Koribacter sp.]|jgi:uncharacterized membrane protein YagU involved in acid resistance
MFTTEKDASRARKTRSFPALIAAGTLVGVLDIVYAFLIYTRLGATPKSILQSIARGILGNGSFAGGYRTAALGLVLHFFIAMSIAGFYFTLARRVAWLNRNAIVSGVLYGAGVYLFMQNVVIPLSAIRHSRLPMSYRICDFFEHMVFVGLPVALAARSAFLSKTSQGEV